MAYAKRIIADADTTDPALGPLSGGRLAKSDRVGAVFNQQDLLLGHGRRVVASVGLHLSPRFQVPSTNTTSVSQTYPLKSASRVCYRGTFTLTPGHMLRAQAVWTPAGATQRFAAGSWVSDGGLGMINFTAQFSNGLASETVNRTIVCDVSPNQYNAETSTEGAMFGELYRGFTEIRPNDLNNVATMAAWSDTAVAPFAGVTVELTISYRGGVRPVDVIVYEVPVAYARDVSTSNWAAALYEEGGKPAKAYPSAYPVLALNTAPGHTGLGSTRLVETATRQRDDLGPLLVTWTAWSEAVQGVAATETAALETSSLTWTEMLCTSTAAPWSADAPGWSITCGANARRWDTSDPYQAMRGNDAVVPVRIWVRAAAPGGSTGYLRFHSEAYSAMGDIEVNSGTYAWYSQTGHLRCGLGAEDTATLQMLGMVAGVGMTLSVRNVTVEYLKN